MQQPSFGFPFEENWLHPLTGSMSVGCEGSLGEHAADVGQALPNSGLQKLAEPGTLKAFDQAGLRRSVQGPQKIAADWPHGPIDCYCGLDLYIHLLKQKKREKPLGFYREFITAGHVLLFQGA